MDLELFRWLLTPDGQALLAEASATDLTEQGQLRTLDRLRQRANPAQAAAAYEIALLRQRASDKFPQAARMYFTREALEQASGITVASYRANRYRRFLNHAQATIADLACSIGGDALAFAQHNRVIGVDRDRLRLAIAAENARVCGLAGQCSFVEADLEQYKLPAAGAIFFDPARRSEGRRLFGLDSYSPPVSIIKRWQPDIPAIGVKVAPGVGDQELPALGELEAEFVSVDGELKEAILWFGPLAEPGRRATLLSRTQPADSTPQLFLAAGAPQPHIPVEPPAAYLYEPDPAVIRAHVVQSLAVQLGAALLDRSIAYLTADRAIATPFARCWSILEWMPFSVKRIQARLRTLDTGPVTVKKRGSPLDTDALARKLSGTGQRPLVVVLTQVLGKPAALICEGPLSVAG